MTPALQFTLVVPTYNRPFLLRRLLAYLEFKRVAFPILVLDSSKPEFIELNRSICTDRFIETIHRESPTSTPPNRKWAEGLDEVCSEFVAFCADDDFISPAGIDSCISFLDSHADYSSAQGHAIAFAVYDNNHVEYSALDLSQVGHRIDAATAELRLHQLFSDYVYQIYSVYRTPIVKVALDCSRNVHNANYGELGAAIAPSILGKHQVLPVFYSARQIFPGVTTSSFEVPRFDVLRIEGKRDYLNWITALASIYADHERVPLETATAVIEDVFREYCEWDLRTYPERSPLSVRDKPIDKEESFREVVKQFIPKAILQYRRDFLFSRRLANMRRSTNSGGFPWSDSASALVWEEMLELIRAKE